MEKLEKLDKIVKKQVEEINEYRAQMTHLITTGNATPKELKKKMVEFDKGTKELKKELEMLTQEATEARG